MDTTSITEGAKDLLPGLLENAKETVNGLVSMAFPDNPQMGILIILVVIALLMRSKISGWMLLAMFVAVGYIFLSGGM